MTRLILAEDWPGDFSPAAGDRVVALTGAACDQLERAGVVYQIPEDHGAEDAVRERQDSFFREELSWFDRLDQWALAAWPNLQKLRRPPTSFFGYHLKTRIDNTFLRGLEARAVWSASTTDVLFLGRPPTADAPISRSAGFWRLWCGRHGRPFRHRSAPPGSGIPRPGKAGVERWAARARLALWKTRGRFASPSSEGAFFLDTYYDLGQLLRRSMANGLRCFLRRSDGVIPLGAGRPWALPDRAALPPAAVGVPPARDAFWEWPRGWFDLDLEPLMRPWLEAWLRDLPVFGAWVDAFERFYRDAGIGRVFFPALRDLTEIAAVAATHVAGSRARSVLVAHGDGPDVAASWDVSELFPGHYYLVPDGEFAAYFESRRREHRRDLARPRVWTGRWPSYARAARKPWVYCDRWTGPRPRWRFRSPPGGIPRDRPIVLYAVSDPEGDERYLNKPSYSEGGYRRLRRAVEEVFPRFPGYLFVVKFYPHQRWTGAAERDASLSAENVRYSYAPFEDWLPWADRVVLDKPSTSLYQSALAGVPFHLLWSDRLPMRDAAMEPFKGSFTLFHRPEEIQAPLAAFLENPRPPRARLVGRSPETVDPLAATRPGTSAEESPC